MATGSECCTNPPVSTAEFTGKDRDNESALDYFGARYYSNQHGEVYESGLEFE